ncbi:DNA alkylation repair protein [Paenibacillus sp. FSL K6-1230]|uniref:DNA alkylation repair protein n=1 Tax=Paenibacillus sp. FSL K6-1230 TaxID=2921603 RepID=UPI0030FAD0E2
MAEPLRDMYNPVVLEQLAAHLKQVYAPFQTASFMKQIFDDTWESLALKERIRHITRALGEHLPADYSEAVQLLISLGNDRQKGLFVLFPDFVEVYGQQEEDWELSMQALEHFTKGSSSEFAVRPFLLQHPERMMEQTQRWACSDNEHVRRLASEGCRPRLPWGQVLPMFREDPLPVLQVLELLKEDPSLYVRKSVANNLNDISKDHPQLVLELANRWRGQHPGTDWIVRHGCRGLLRTERAEAYALFEYADLSQSPSRLQHARIDSEPARVTMGESSVLSWQLTITEPMTERVRIEYAIDFVKANGKSSRKKFLLVDHIFSQAETFHRTRTHRWADLTTRKHYPGIHRITLLANGVTLAETEVVVIESSIE